MGVSRRTFLSTGFSVGTAAATGLALPAIGRAQDADVIIMGAGLSGLHAARLLQAEGVNVLVVEASARIGGRLWTLDDVPGAPEGGGQQVGRGYARMLAAGAELGIDFVDPPAGTMGDGSTMVLQGQKFDASEWVNRPENPFPEDFKAITPDGVLFRSAARLNPFETRLDWLAATGDDDISAAMFLDDLGFDGRARQLCDITLNANQLASYSMANLWRTLTIYSEDVELGPSVRVAGGSQRLPEAMAASLGDGAVRLSTPVRAIHAGDDGVEVMTDNATLRAPYGICTIPYGALRHIPMTYPNGAFSQSPIIAGLPYTQIQEVHLSLESGPSDGLPASMWSDGFLERVFAWRDRETAEITGLVVWLNGTGTHPFASDDTLLKQAEDELMRLRGIKAKAHKLVRWDVSDPLSGGAYMHWAPGQIAAWGEDIVKPAGRMHFAGEHTGRQHTGMEAAMESGERAAFDVLTEMAG